MRPVESSPTGTGNSPPARNLADSPEMAVRLGSARVRTSPTRSKACIIDEAWFSPGVPEVCMVVAVW